MDSCNKRRRTESYAQCRLVIPDCGMIDSSLDGVKRVAILRGDAAVSIGRDRFVLFALLLLLGSRERRNDRSFDARIRLKKDLMVSKSHASVYFDGEEYTWNIVDLGSTHGTVLVRQDEGTGIRLSQPKVASTPRRLLHLE